MRNRGEERGREKGLSCQEGKSHRERVLLDILMEADGVLLDDDALFDCMPEGSTGVVAIDEDELLDSARVEALEGIGVVVAMNAVVVPINSMVLEDGTANMLALVLTDVDDVVLSLETADADDDMEVLVGTLDVLDDGNAAVLVAVLGAAKAEVTGALEELDEVNAAALEVMLWGAKVELAGALEVLNNVIAAAFVMALEGTGVEVAGTLLDVIDDMNAGVLFAMFEGAGVEVAGTLEVLDDGNAAMLDVVLTLISVDDGVLWILTLLYILDRCVLE